MQIICQGLKINYSLQGSGPALLMLHGWGSSQKDFQPLIDELGSSYRIITIDLPGFGQSERPNEVWGVENYTQFTKDFLEQINQKNIEAVVGHSFGGRVAIYGVGYGILHPKKLILLGAAGIRHNQSLRNRAYKIVAKLGKAFFSIPMIGRFRSQAKNRLYDMADAQDYISSSEMRDIFVRVINKDLRAEASQIDLATLLVWGSEDSDSPINDARIFNKLIPGSKLFILQNAGHYVHVDQSRQVARIMREFLR